MGKPTGFMEWDRESPPKRAKAERVGDSKEFVLPLIEPAAEQMLVQMHSLDPKSSLQEWTQSHGKGIPQYHTTTAEGPDHAKVFQIEVHVAGKCMGVGTGPSKHAAQQAAAQAALEAIANLGEEE